MATIKDVARLAGVSIATVSNYLNNTKQVSKESAQKIQNAVDELHYTLNQNARSLKSRQNTDIGVILPSLNDPYLSSCFRELNHIFNLRSTTLILPFQKTSLNLRTPLHAISCANKYVDLFWFPASLKTGNFIMTTIPPRIFHLL